MLPAVSAEECQFICEADERCASAKFVEASLACAIQAKPSSSSAPPPESDGVERPVAPGKRRVSLVTYADGDMFTYTQHLLHESMQKAGIQEHWRWNGSTLREEEPHASWWRRNRRANFKRGGAWKPYIIWQAFRRVRWGDWLIYHDSSQYLMEGFASDVNPLLQWLEARHEENPCECIAATRLRQTFEHEWESRCVPPYGEPRDFGRAFETFCSAARRIGACQAAPGPECCRSLWQAPTHQHSWSVWRKNVHSARFLRDWAERSAEPDLIGSMPLVDQSMNALLVYRWRTEISLCTLWLPRLYEELWTTEGDHGNSGRLEGLPFKHLNGVLQALWNSLVLGEDLVFLVDPGADGPGTALPGAAPEVAWWSAPRTPPHLWRESLCLAADGSQRQGFSSNVVAARLDVQLVGGKAATRIPWGKRWKLPNGWASPIISDFKGDASTLSWNAALPSHPRRLWRQATPSAPLATSEFSLGTWLLDVVPVIRDKIGGKTDDRVRLEEIIGDEYVWIGAKMIRVAQVAVVADLSIVNDGTEPWPRDVKFCQGRGGNSSVHFRTLTECIHMKSNEKLECDAVQPGEAVRMELVAVLPRDGQLPGKARAKEAEEVARRGGVKRFHRMTWGLCDPNRMSEPFGITISAHVRFV